MVTRKTSTIARLVQISFFKKTQFGQACTIAFMGILITAWLMVFLTHVEAETTDKQQQALIGEWRGVWEGFSRASSTLIVHEIDTAKAKARCTFTDPYLSEKKYPVLADFTPGPNPKLEFKLEGNDYNFVLKKGILQGGFKGLRAMGYMSTTIEMEKYPKK